MISITNGFAWNIDRYGNQYMGTVYVKRDTAYTQVGTLEQVKQEIGIIIKDQD